MADIAKELSWWEQPQVTTKVHLSQYQEEVRLISDANKISLGESDEQRGARLESDAFSVMSEALFIPLSEARSRPVTTRRPMRW
jgi:hypothetical protein